MSRPSATARPGFTSRTAPLCLSSQAHLLQGAIPLIASSIVSSSASFPAPIRAVHPAVGKPAAENGSEKGSDLPVERG